MKRQLTASALVAMFAIYSLLPAFCDNTFPAGFPGGGGSGGVSQIVAGSGVGVSPAGGTGIVTVTALGSGGGSVTSVTAPTGNWPTWIVPSVVNTTTTPVISVAMGTTGASTWIGTNGAGTIGPQTGVLPNSLVDFAAPAAIGSTTPAAGSFTNLSYSGTFTGVANSIPAADVAAGALANSMTATTQTTGDTSSKLATDLFVSNAVAAATTGVSQIIAGTNVTISPVGGTGAVTINSSGGGGLSAIANNQLIANISGSSAVPIANFATSALFGPNYLDNNHGGTGNLLLLPHWRSLIPGVLAKTGNVEIWCTGDSTTKGLYASNQYLTSYPPRLTQYLNNAGVPATEGLCVPTSADTRWVFTGWSTGTAQPNGENTIFANSGVTQTASFSPGANVSYDSIKVYWSSNGNGNGTTSTINVNGGSSIGTINNNTGGLTRTGGAIGAQTFTCTRTTGGTINLVPPGSGTNYMFINGLELYDSQNPCVHITQYGVQGNVINNMNSQGTTGLSSMITLLNPTVTILDFVINDSVLGTGTSTYQTQLAAVIAACQVTGDVIVGTGNPCNPSQVATSTYQQYVNAAAAAAAAASPQALVVDTFQDFGASYTYWQGNGFSGDSLLHDNDAGYADLARDFFLPLSWTSEGNANASGTGGGGGGSGTVTQFTAPTGNWPTWLVPSVATGTTTPVLSVAAGTTGASTWIGTNGAGTIGPLTSVIPNSLINFAAPAAIGSTTPAAVSATNFSYTGTFTGVANSIAAADIASGALANGMTGTTQTTGDTSTKLATDQFVAAAVAAAGVSQIIAGTNVTISPVGGTGAVTINASGGGGGGSSVGGSGADGAITKTTQTETTVIEQNATTWTNTASDTYTVHSGTVINGSTSITVPGTLAVSADIPGGYAGTATHFNAGSGQSGGSGGGVTASSSVAPGGGGGGGAGAGGTGGSWTTVVYLLGGGAGVPQPHPGWTGSGGSSAGNSTPVAGGNGGGVVRLCSAGAITVSSGGSLTAIGGNGVAADAGSGGGSGGGVFIYSTTSITQTGTGSVAGGNGANASTYGGGGGGGGGMYLRHSPSNTGAGTITVSGGAGGTAPGGGTAGTAGSSGVSISITGTPTFPLIAEQEKHADELAVLAKIEQAVGKQGSTVKWTQKENVSFLAALESKDDEFQRTAFYLNNGTQLDGHGKVALLFVGDYVDISADAA